MKITMMISGAKVTIIPLGGQEIRLIWRINTCSDGITTSRGQIGHFYLEYTLSNVISPLMRYSIAIFFSVLMLAVSSREMVHFIVFKLNQDYISQVFCINKDKPELKCDGKCYLKKTIDESKQEKKSKPTPPLPDEKSIVLFYDFTGVQSETFREAKSSKYFTYLALILPGQSKDIHHPPDSNS
jgi:hypothetical protein